MNDLARVGGEWICTLTRRSPETSTNRPIRSDWSGWVEAAARAGLDAQSRVTRFDETPVPGSSPDDIDLELARRFLRPDADVTLTALRKLGVVAYDEEGVARITVSGAVSLGRSHIMDRRGDGVPVIRERSRQLSGRLPEYELIDGSELRLVIWAAT